MGGHHFLNRGEEISRHVEFELRLMYVGQAHEFNYEQQLKRVPRQFDPDGGIDDESKVEDCAGRFDFNGSVGSVIRSKPMDA